MKDGTTPLQVAKKDEQMLEILLEKEETILKPAKRK